MKKKQVNNNSAIAENCSISDLYWSIVASLKTISNKKWEEIAKQNDQAKRNQSERISDKKRNDNAEQTNSKQWKRQ
jgi:hypothetical protein